MVHAFALSSHFLPPRNPGPHLYSSCSLIMLFGLGLKVLSSSVIAWFYVVICYVSDIFNKMVIAMSFYLLESLRLDYKHHESFALSISVTTAFLVSDRMITSK